MAPAVAAVVSNWPGSDWSGIFGHLQFGVGGRVGGDALELERSSFAAGAVTSVRT